MPLLTSKKEQYIIEISECLSIMKVLEVRRIAIFCKAIKFLDYRNLTDYFWKPTNEVENKLIKLLRERK